MGDLGCRANHEHRGQSIVTPRFHIAVQNGFLSDDAAVPPPSMLADVYTIGGSPLRCLEGDTHAQFIAYSQTTIENRITNALESNGVTDYATTTRHFTLDMEHPNDGVDTFAHPTDLHQADATKQDEIVTAWKTRIAAARVVLPFAKLSMYGTLIPDGNGDETNATYAARLAALIEAGTEGLYDGLDYLAPVIYPRFGPTDTQGNWTSLAAYTRLGVDGSRQLRKSDTSRLPLLPFLYYRVANGNSNHHDDILLDMGLEMGFHSTLLAQVSVLAGRDVDDVVLWVGSNETNTGILPAPNDGDWTLSQLLVRLMPTTTVDLIRTQMVSVLEAVTPTSQTGVKFRSHRDEVEFFDWCGANKEAAFRRFEVQWSGGYEGPEVTNTDLEWHRTELTVTLAYPLTWGKYGAKNRASLLKMVEEDVHQFDDLVGLRGAANWTGGSWAIKKPNDEKAEQGGVLFVRMTFDVGYYRSV